MHEQGISLSPRQSERLEQLEARYPATTFTVYDVDPYSAVLTLEAEDLAGFTYFAITASGRTVATEIAEQWAHTR